MLTSEDPLMNHSIFHESLLKIEELSAAELAKEFSKHDLLKLSSEALEALALSEIDDLDVGDSTGTNDTATELVPPDVAEEVEAPPPPTLTDLGTIPEESEAELKACEEEAPAPGAVGRADEELQLAQRLEQEVHDLFVLDAAVAHLALRYQGRVSSRPDAVDEALQHLKPAKPTRSNTIFRAMNHSRDAGRLVFYEVKTEPTVQSSLNIFPILPIISFLVASALLR
jgi:hypothetical protein